MDRAENQYAHSFLNPSWDFFADFHRYSSDRTYKGLGVPSHIFHPNTGIFVQGHSKPAIFSYFRIEIEKFSNKGVFGGLNRLLALFSNGLC